MSRIVDESAIVIEDLVCPITLEVFRDPVIAQDGHAYEREAITKWILEHGTSPLTREPLQVDLLQADERLRQLCQQRRNSAVCYNVRSQTITLPPREKKSKVQSENSNIIRQIRSSKYFCQILVLTICICVICVVVTIGIVFGIKNASKGPPPLQITSQYLSSLTPNDSQFTRHRGANNKSYYYKAILLNASVYGTYQVKSISKIDLYGYLYSGYFISEIPSLNLLQYDDDSGGNQQFLFNAWLTPDNSTLVVTTYTGNITGPFSIVITGPGTVVFSKR